MGILVLVMGKSGSGKTSSLRNFKPGEIGIFNPASKPLPFKNDIKEITNKPTYTQIIKSLQANNLNAYLIDDANYLMAYDSFDKAKVSGYGKWTDMAQSFKNLLDTSAKTNDDTIVYFFMHPDFDDDGDWKPATTGKMLDNSFTNLAGLFTYCFIASNVNGEYKFLTSSKKHRAVKAGFGIFEEDEIDNDLKLIDTKLREAYGLAPLGTKQKKADSTAPTKEVEKTEVSDSKGAENDKE